MFFKDFELGEVRIWRKDLKFIRISLNKPWISRRMLNWSWIKFDSLKKRTQRLPLSLNLPQSHPGSLCTLINYSNFFLVSLFLFLWTKNH